MNPEQALNLMAQIINQTKFTLAEGEQVKQAYQILAELVQKNNSPVIKETPKDGSKTLP